jgi:wobble nucleotide-excising tRNase
MAHTHSQDLESRFNSLYSNFTETQQEVRQLSANVSTINKNMHSSIDAKIEDIKQDLATHLASFTMMIFSKLHIPVDLPSSDPPLQPEGETSSHSHNF